MARSAASPCMPPECRYRNLGLPLPWRRRSPASPLEFEPTDVQERGLRRLSPRHRVLTRRRCRLHCSSSCSHQGSHHLNICSDPMSRGRSPVVAAPMTAVMVSSDVPQPAMAVALLLHLKRMLSPPRECGFLVLQFGFRLVESVSGAKSDGLWGALLAWRVDGSPLISFVN